MCVVPDKSIRFILNEELHAFVYLEYGVLVSVAISVDFTVVAGSDWAVLLDSVIRVN